MSKKQCIPPNYLHKNTIEQEAKVKIQKIITIMIKEQYPRKERKLTKTGNTL